VTGESVGVPRDRLQADALQRGVDEAVPVTEQIREDERDGDGRDDVWQQHSHAPEGLRAQVLVEERGEEHREHHLRNAGEQEDAEGVAEGDPELRLAQHVGVLVESDPRPFAADLVPVHERDDRRIGDGEKPHDEEQQEERRNVEVRRELQVPAREARSEAETPRRDSGHDRS